VKRKSPRKTVPKSARKTKQARTAKPEARRRVNTAAGHSKSKAPQPDALDMLVTAQTAALNLPIDPSWHGAVKVNLQLILRLGAMVDDFALPDDAEPGPIFHA
jgi:hypothetical protein